MMDDLVIVNLRPNGTEVTPTALTSLHWQTCLRRIVFLHRSEFDPRIFTNEHGAEIYFGREAYQFLLEVICGLHSPLVGENAVMGQFRKFRNDAKFPNTAWGRFLRTLTTDLLVDARSVRHHHLQGLGSQSYGSLIRRYVKAVANVAVVGAGSLAREILPWLTDVRVFYRNYQHARDLQNEHPHIQIEQFKKADAGWNNDSASLIIAAPISPAEMNEWVALQKVAFSPILDLRSDAATNPIHSTSPVINLSELLASLHEERERIVDRVTTARQEIEALATKRSTKQILARVA